jgi:hypothetical protein
MSRGRARLPHPAGPSTADDQPTETPSQPCAGSVFPAHAKAAELFLVWDMVDEWGAQSFPASDPPANW